MAHSVAAISAALVHGSAQGPSIAQASAVRALQQELKKLKEEPVEGFIVQIPDEANMFEWEVAIFGSPGSLYEGGYFKAHMRFPGDYPYSPPTVKFLCKMWHPNVYENGEVCISILHPPVDDPQSGELPCERWNPTQSVRTILLSIISLLNEPNTSSPANVDASVAYRKWIESKGRDSFYEDIVRNEFREFHSWSTLKPAFSPSLIDGMRHLIEFRLCQKQVLESKLEAEKDGIVVPMTLQQYCHSSKPTAPSFESQSSVDFDYYDSYSVDADDSDSDIVTVTS